MAFSQQFEILSEKAALMEAEESEEKMFSNVDYSPLPFSNEYVQRINIALFPYFYPCFEPIEVPDCEQLIPSLMIF